MLEKTRKIIWGRSGNRCAICRHELVVEATPSDPDSVVGDECHIVSGKPLGPRYDPAFPLQDLDAPENIILLCRIHHKMVDDQHETYTVGVLRELKANHEKWVSTALSDAKCLPPVRLRRMKGSIPDYLFRLTSGRDIMRIVGDACAFSFEHDEPSSNAEVELLGSFLQCAQDYGDLWGEIEAGRRVEVEFEMSGQLQQLEEAGFWVFGAREEQRLEGGVGTPSPFPVAILRVLRATSSEIIKADLRKETEVENAQSKEHHPERQ